MMGMGQGTLILYILLCCAVFGVVLLAVMVMYSTLLLFGRVRYVYTEIDAPASRELVFLEKTYGLFGGDGDIYECTSPCILRKLADYVTDNGITPVHDGHYAIEWRERGGTLVPGETYRIDFSFHMESAYKS